jgi:hypothetical protein
MEEITDLLDSAKVLSEEDSAINKEHEVMTKKVQDKVDKLLKELGYAFEAPKKRKPRTKKKAGAAKKKPKKAVAAGAGKGKGRKKKVAFKLDTETEEEEETQEITFVVDDKEHEDEEEDILSDEIEDFDNMRIPQADGGVDSPIEDDDDDEDEDYKDMEKFKLEAIERIKSDNEKLYGTENVMICQYEKVCLEKAWIFLFIFYFNHFIIIAGSSSPKSVEVRSARRDCESEWEGLCLWTSHWANCRFRLALTLR